MELKTESGQSVIITATEHVILKCASEGLSTRETADKRKLSAKTVEAQRYNILRKTGGRNITHVVSMMFRQGLLK